MSAGRVTIVDVARRAGVAKSTVSYALNDHPGVSPATRERVRRIALEMGWRPSSVARALSGSRAGVCGLVLARDPHAFSLEPFFSRLTGGLESELSRHQTALMVQFVATVDDEIEAYRGWWAEHRVDGVIMIDARVGDPRLRLHDSVGVPAVLLTNPDSDTDLPCLAFDDAAAMRSALEHLHGLGHRRIGWVAGPADFQHTVDRRAGFDEACGRLGLTGSVIFTDYAAEAGARACRSLLDGDTTALIFDNDVMAMAGLAVLTAAGVEVPRRMSVISWEDSPLCATSYPPLTALHRDQFDYGVLAARALLDVIAGEEVPSRHIGVQRLVVRQSTGRREAA